MKIEMLTNYKHDDGSGLQLLQTGEVRIVADNLGKALCDAGMAKDMSGEHATAERDTHRVIVLDPDNAQNEHIAREVN